MTLPIRPVRFIDRLNNFGGGLATSLNPLLHDVSQTPRCMNVISRGKTRYLAKRPGRTLLASVTSAEGNGGKDFKPVGLERKVVAKFGTILYKMDGLDGTWDSLTTGLLDVPASFEIYTVAKVNYLIVLSDGQEKPLRWDGVAASTRFFGSSTTSGATDTDTVTPIFRSGKAWRTRFWGCGIPNQPNILVYSEANSFSIPSGNNIAVDVQSKDDGLMGFGELRNVMYIFTPFSIQRATYLGGNPLVDIKPAVIGVGCTAVKTIQNIVFKGREVLIFLGTDKRVYTFDGYTVEPITVAIDEDNEFSQISMATLNNGGIQHAHASKDDTKQLYSLFCPNLSSARMSHRLVFDYSGDGAWWAYNNQGMKSSTTAVDSLNRQRMLGFDYTGSAFYMDEGTTDAGTAISAEWVSHKLTGQIPDATKGSTLDFVTRRLGNFRIKGSYRTEFADDFSTETGTQGDIALSSSGDTFLGETFSLGTSVLGGPAAIQTSIDLPENFTRLEIRVRDNPDDPIEADPWVLLEIIPQGVTLAAAYGSQNQAD